MAFPSGWARKCAITIDQSLCGSSDSTNFTVLLTRDNLPDEMCSPTDGNRAQSDGGDIRFSSDSAGSTQLALHVEAWEYDTTDAAGDADIELNVKVPTLDTSSDTVIYAWYNTTGTTSQPAADDTYGAQNAYDEYHCHVWHLNESPGDTPPEYKDVVGGRDLTETGGTATSVTGKIGGAFDGGAAAIAYGDYAGFLAPDNTSGDPCTNTGLCFIPKNGYLAVMNFDDEEVIIVNPATGAEVSSFALTQGETAVQGLAYDSVADQFIVAQNASATNTVYDYNGTYDRTLTAGQNAVAYDFADDAVWCLDAGSGDIEQINKTTGAQITSITFTGDAAGIAVDGITHNNTDDTLFVTTDTGDMIYEINKSTGATIRSFRGPFDIEHPAYDYTNDVLYVNGDGGYHSPGELGESVIIKMNPTGGPYDWRAPSTEYTLELWVKPDSVAGTTILFGNWASVKPSAFYQELQCRNGTLRQYDTSVALLDDAAALSNGTWSYITCRYEDATNELKTFIDASNTATKSSAACDIGPDGRIGIGGRPNDTLNHNGAIDDVRLSLVARSTDWITARYNNSNNPAAFASAGTPEAGDLATTLTPSGIASAEAFGSGTASPGSVAITPSGLASAEAHGTTTLSLSMLAQSIASAAAFGSATLSPGAVSVIADAIASAEAFGSLTVSNGATTVVPGAIASGEAFGTVSVSVGTVAISLSGIASAEGIGPPVAAVGAVALSPDPIASLDGIGAHTITVGDAVISTSAIAPTEIFGAPILTGGTQALGWLIAEAYVGPALQVDISVAPALQADATMTSRTTQ